MKRFVRCIVLLALAAALLCGLTIPAYANSYSCTVGQSVWWAIDANNIYEVQHFQGLPPGLTVGLNDNCYIIHGTPTTAGTFTANIYYDTYSYDEITHTHTITVNDDWMKAEQERGIPATAATTPPTTEDWMKAEQERGIPATAATTPPTTEDWMKAEQERGIPTTAPTTPPTTAATTPPTTAATTPPTTAATTPPTTAATTPPTTAPAVDTTTSAEMKITKHPTGEVVNPGGTALFVARADHSAWCAWRFIGPDGTEVVFDAVGNRFPGLRISGGNEGTLRLENIPVELNGWKAACLFSDGVSKRLTTSGALITVTAPTQATTAPTTAPTTPPTTAPTAPPTTAPTIAPTTLPATMATTVPTTAAVIPAAVTEAVTTASAPTGTTEPGSKNSGSTVLLIAAIAIMAATLGGGATAIVLALNKRKQTKSRYSIKRFRCDKCGWKPVKPGELPNFCPNCGDIFNRDDVEW